MSASISSGVPRMTPWSMTSPAAKLSNGSGPPLDCSSNLRIGPAAGCATIQPWRATRSMGGGISPLSTAT